MIPEFNLADYFQRIGYDGGHTATLETLRAVQYHHATSIPFENLNPFLGIPVRLDIQSIVQKLIYNKRGGYCFEHNLLLKHILESIGFSVTGLAARVRWNAPDDVITARGHMLLLVELGDEQYIVDTGFGLLTPTAPLKLIPDIEQHTAHEIYRLIWKDNNFDLEANIRNDWKTLYRFDLQEQFLPDYEVTNWYLSNHPESHFVNGLIVDQPGRDRRFALHNNKFSVRYLNGKTEDRILTSPEEIYSILIDTFKLIPPEVPALNEQFKKLTESEVTV